MGEVTLNCSRLAARLFLAERQQLKLERRNA